MKKPHRDCWQTAWRPVCIGACATCGRRALQAAFWRNVPWNNNVSMRWSTRQICCYFFLWLKESDWSCVLKFTNLRKRESHSFEFERANALAWKVFYAVKQVKSFLCRCSGWKGMQTGGWEGERPSLWRGGLDKYQTKTWQILHKLEVWGLAGPWLLAEGLQTYWLCPSGLSGAQAVGPTQIISKIRTSKSFQEITKS